MAWTWSVNQRPATGSVAMFMILSNYIAAGWTVQMSSDGTTYKSTAGSQITNGGAGANGMANAKAWFRIQDPGGVREFIVQRSASGNVQWAIKYSPAAKFTGGSPAATQVPTATDEVPILGNITGVTQTYTNFFSPGDGNFNLHMGMADATIGYAFWIQGLQIANNSSIPAGAWMMDWMVGPDAGDLDPTVHYASGTQDLRQPAASTGVAFAFFTAITSGDFTQVSIQGYLRWGPLVGATADNNSWNGYEDSLPALWADTTTGYKGWSSLYRMTASQLHNTGDLASVGNPPVMGAKDHVFVGEWNEPIMLPWPAGVDFQN